MVKILVIDDNEIEITSIISRMLKGEGYDVSTTNNPLNGLGKLYKEKYDLCFVDIQMGEMRGTDLIKEAISLGCKTSFVIITGNSIMNDIIDLGVDEIIRKPFNMDDVLLVTKRVLKCHENKMKEIDIVNKNENKLFTDIIMAFVDSIEARDSYTGGHSKRVSEISIRIGRQLELPEKKIEEIRIGALLHDIGKISVSDLILQKPIALTDEEYEKIKSHTKSGHEIIKHMSELLFALPYILNHHERIDGSGYPNGLKGNEIPIEGKIIAVADSYDAMTTQRVYRDKPKTPEEAKEELKELSGTKYDPKIVDAFLKIDLSDMLPSANG